MPQTASWILEAIETFAGIYWETYGRVPATVDPMATLLWFQALHLDTNFCGRYCQKGAYTKTIRDHMKHWHPQRAD